MAIKMTIKATDGREIEGAYWVPGQINIGIADEGGQITMHAFASPELRAEGNSPLAGAVKQFPFNRDQFYAAQRLTMGQLLGAGKASDSTTFYQVIATFAYTIAKSRKDVPVLDADGKPVLDVDGKPEMRSFFADGVDA